MDSTPSSGIIRRFSDKLVEQIPESHLSQGLAAKVEADRQREKYPNLDPTDQWNLLVSDAGDWAIRLVPDDEHALFEQSQKLNKAWEKFQQCLPKERKQALNGQRPDMEHLFNAVKNASDSWTKERSQTRFGRAKKTWDDLCTKFVDHKQILSVVPKDDKYISLLTGSLSTIAHAAANHRKIADAVEEGLKDLTQDINFWNHQMREYQRQNGDITALNHYIVELYVVVFEFLTEIFEKWSKSTRTRFISSFDEGVFNRIFKEKRSRIDTIAERMAREVELQRSRTTDQKLLDMKINFEKLSQITEANSAFQRTLLLALGTNVQHLLQGQENTMQLLLPPQTLQLNQDMVQRSRTPSPKPSSVSGSPSAGSVKSDEMPSSDPPILFRSRTEILCDLKHLQEEYNEHMSVVAKMALRAKRLQIDPAVQRELLSWIGSSKKDRLWISGPHGVARPSQNTLTAVNLVALARTSKISCLTYFCEARNNQKPQPSRSQRLLGMLSSLIIQTLLVMPEDTELTSISTSHIAALKNRTIEVGEALLLFRSLRKAAPQFVHIIIDGIRSLENPADREHNLNLVNTLGTICTSDSEESSNEPNRSKIALNRMLSAPDCPRNVSLDDGVDVEPSCTITKVCFTTDGHADSLARITNMKLLRKVQFDIEAFDLRAGDVVGFNS